MTDLDLIKNIKDNRDSESLKCLISRHSGIFCEMVKRYQYFISQKGHDPKDLYEDKDVIVYQSALSFNEYTGECLLPTTDCNFCSGGTPPPEGLTVVIPGPQWMPETAQFVQERLKNGNYTAAKC
jgi:hypothetical protein